MAAFPSYMKVGALHYSVHSDAGRIVRHVRDLDDTGVIGLHDSHLLTIDVDPSLAPDVRASTLLHEVLHACFNVGGNREKDGYTEEDAVRAVATTLLQVLRDNPDLVAFLNQPYGD